MMALWKYSVKSMRSVKYRFKVMVKHLKRTQPLSSGLNFIDSGFINPSPSITFAKIGIRCYSYRRYDKIPGR
jgi:hypothetical protein